MPPAKGPYDTRLHLKECWGIKTGCMKKHELLETKTLDGNCFVLLTKRSSWLCRAVADKATFDRPLQRTTLLERLKKEVTTQTPPPPPEEQDGLDGKAEDLRFGSDEEVLEDVGAHDGGPGKQDKKDALKRQRRRKAPAPVCASSCQMPRFSPAVQASNTETVEVHVLSDGRNIWLRMDGLPWFLQFMRDEWHSAGIRAPEKQRSEDIADGIAWDFRDRAWQGFAKEGPVQPLLCILLSAPLRFLV